MQYARPSVETISAGSPKFKLSSPQRNMSLSDHRVAGHLVQFRSESEVAVSEKQSPWQ